jgi:hypothetical protein
MDLIHLLLVLATIFAIHNLLFLLKHNLRANFASAILLSTICGVVLSFCATFLLILYLCTWIIVIKFVSLCLSGLVYRFNDFQTTISLVIVSQFIDWLLILSIGYILIL